MLGYKLGKARSRPMTSTPPLAPKVVALKAQAGWMDSDNSDRETFDVRQVKVGDYRIRNLAGNEPAYFTERYIEYTENEWYSFVIDCLTSSLFSGMKFVGPGAKDVYEFLDVTCPDAREELFLAGLEAVRDGTGFLLKIREGETGEGALRQIKYYTCRNLDMEYQARREEETMEGDWYKDYNDGEAGDDEQRFIFIKDKENEESKWYFREYPRLALEDYRNPLLAVIRLRKSHITPWGVPIGKSCFHSFKALKGINRDVVSALKKVASNIIVLKYDSSAYSDSDKETKVQEIGDTMSGFEPASSNVIVLDKMHDIGYIANLEGHGGGYDGRLIEVMKHLEPVLSSILLNYSIAIGLVEQTGANKSLIARQIVEANRERKRLQNSVATFLKTQIIPDITNNEVDILFETSIETEFVVQLFSSGAISREWTQEYLGVYDEGSTFMTPLMGAGGGKDNLNPDASNNDDSSSSKQRVGGQSSKAGAT